jgi:hypothetical protein
MLSARYAMNLQSGETIWNPTPETQDYLTVIPPGGETSKDTDGVAVPATTGGPVRRRARWPVSSALGCAPVNCLDQPKE